jgi:fatty-acyl-CoA synthase
VTNRAHDWVAYHANRRPDDVALASVDTGLQVTWATLEDRVGRLAHILRHRFRVEKGDRVSCIAENDPRVFELQFACMRLGAMLVPLNWRLAIAELVDICLDCEPKVLVHDGAWEETAGILADKAGTGPRFAWGAGGLVPDYEGLQQEAGFVSASPDLSLDDPTHILYTSGTTGRPKGALSTQGTLLWNAHNLACTTGVADAGCNMLNPMPLFHAGGLHTCANPILHFGGRVATMAKFEPSTILARFVDSDPPVTHIALIPLMYQALADQPGFTDARFPDLRYGIVAGAIADPELLRLWADKGVPLQPQYGGTEMGPCALALERSDVERGIAGSVGTPVFSTDVLLAGPDGEEVAAGEVGEIWLRGPSVSPGYWRIGQGDFFTGDWFRTGDAAWRDSDGYHYLAGRLKDMYKSGGENVYPAEVELVLARAPGVQDIAVVGVADERWGEVGLALIVPIPGARPTLEDLGAFAAGKLARYKVPKRLVLVENLGRNVTGKVDKAAVREKYA